MDRRFDNKNNYKKTHSVFASSVIELAAGEISDNLFTLPKASLVTTVSAIVLSAGATDEELVTKVGNTTIATNGIDTVGVDAQASNLYFGTGGGVTLTGTLTAPTKVKLVIEYIEVDLVTGEATD